VKFRDVLFLDAESLEEAHADEARVTGHSTVLRDRLLLDTAVMAPRALFEGEPVNGSLGSMAAALGYFLARNHAFAEGNTGIALVAMVAFLEFNGVTVILGDEWEEVLGRVAKSECSRAALGDHLVAVMGADVPVTV
jgi:death-on-curing protein